MCPPKTLPPPSVQVVVLTSILSELLSGAGPFLRFVRLGRAMRPLRFVHRSETLRVVLFALVESLSVVGQLFFLLSCIYSAFAIAGMTAFMGRFAYCNWAGAAGQVRGVQAVGHCGGRDGGRGERRGKSLCGPFKAERLVRTDSHARPTEGRPPPPFPQRTHQKGSDFRGGPSSG